MTRYGEAADALVAERYLLPADAETLKMSAAAAWSRGKRPAPTKTTVARLVLTQTKSVRQRATLDGDLPSHGTGRALGPSLGAEAFRQSCAAHQWAIADCARNASS